ncbi:proton-coupled folate transporter-like [Littorina saxatilis]|uniref:Major facilitator superfamily (MFS) profile domain-containing protein n=1 Tax=Littorina saxatilis TaxID=31220 RepID=A0AAN9GDL1_9CAEN
MADKSDDSENSPLLRHQNSDDGGTHSNNTPVNRHRNSDNRPSSDGHAREHKNHDEGQQARDGEMGQGYEGQRPNGNALCKSWSGDHDNANGDHDNANGDHDNANGDLQQTQHDTRLSKSLTSKPNLSDSQPKNGVVADVILGSQLTKEEKDDADPCRKRVQRRLMTSVSVALLCYITGLLSLVPIQSQYLFRRFAAEYFNITNVTSETVPCATGRNDSLQEDLNQIQTKTSRQILYMEYTQFIPAIFISLLVGSYADYLGRKYLVFVPLTGAFLKSLVFVVVIYLDLDVNYLYFAYTLDGLSGSLYVLLLGLSASIADVTTSARERVLLFAVLEVMLALAGAVSQIGTGYLIKGLGFPAPTLILCCLLFVGCVVLFFFMPETLKKPDHVVLSPVVHLRKVFGFYFFDGTVLNRALFGCVLLIFFFITMINLGKFSVETLYEINTPFCWDSVRIGLFSGLRMFVQNLVGVFTLKTLSKVVRLEVIGMLGLLSGAAGFAVEAFADSDLMMYLSAVVGILVTVVSPIVRTLLSKMAPAKSQGALFASVAAVETVCHLTSTTIYNQVYMATINQFAGAVFILMAIFLFVDFLLLILFAVVSRNVLFYQDIQVEINVDVDIARPPSLPSSSTDEETQPLLQSCPKSMTNSQAENDTQSKRRTSAC